MVQGWGFTSTKVQTVFCDTKNVDSSECDSWSGNYTES
jgi:hypothetical protein